MNTITKNKEKDIEIVPDKIVTTMDIILSSVGIVLLVIVLYSGEFYTGNGFKWDITSIIPIFLQILGLFAIELYILMLHTYIKDKDKVNNKTAKEVIKI